MKIEYLDNELKRKYKSILSQHTIIDSIVGSLPSSIGLSQDLKNVNTKVVDITRGNSFLCITILLENIPVDIRINYENKKISVSSINLPYQIIYDDYSRKFLAPRGYKYQNNDRIIFDKYLVRLNPASISKHAFILSCIKNEYDIYLDVYSSFFDKNEFINKLLYSDNSIDNIGDLMLLISQILNLNECKIKVEDCTNKIVIDNGKLADYSEYLEFQNEVQRIYFSNNEFYIERKTCEKCEASSYIKKLGVYNGKEKK